MQIVALMLFTLSAVSWGAVTSGGPSETSAPVAAPAEAPVAVAEPYNQSLLYFANPSGYTIAAYPGAVFTGDRGCSPSALLSYVTLEKQVVPVEEADHLAVRLLQTPSTGPNSVPDNVVWLDLESGVLVTGIPKLNFTQQTTIFNYTLLTPGLVDLPKYRTALASLTQLISGLALGSSSSSTRYRCATQNPELEPLAEYLAEIRADISNATLIDGGLKKGIEYRVSSGCIVELDALYSGNPIGGVITNSSSSPSKQPTADDCCKACRAQLGCSEFVFCPSFEGCTAGSTPFPSFGCQLQSASLSADPTAFPPATARGPPVVFQSGRLA